MTADKIKSLYISVLNYNLNPKRKKFLFGSLMVIIFAAVFTLNMQQPLFTDDWEYSFVHRLYDCNNKGVIMDERISSVSDILKSQYEHYFTWGGRSVNHIIAQLLLFIGAPINKILNALAYIALTYIIYLFSKRRDEKNRLSLYLLINILIFFFIPVLGSTLLWITGSSNYLWGTLILLLFLLPYKYLYEEKNNNNSIPKAFILFVGGIIAGWTNENVVATTIFFLFICLFYLKKTKQIIPLWFYSGFLGAIIGFLFMLLAPGNYLRYEVANQLKGFEETPKIVILLEQLSTAVSGIFFYLLGIISLYLLILFIYKYNGHKNNKTISLSFIYFSFGVLATLVMTFAPVFPERTFFGIIIFLIIGITSLYNNLDFSSNFIRELKIWGFSLSVLAMSGYYVSGYKDLSKAKKVFDKREQIMAEQKEKGVTDFVFDEKITSKSRINNVYDLTNDPDYWTNCFYARYYGVNSVTVIKSECK